MALDVALPGSELSVGDDEVACPALPLETLVGAGDHLGVLLSVLPQHRLLWLPDPAATAVFTTNQTDGSHLPAGVIGAPG